MLDPPGGSDVNGYRKKVLLPAGIVQAPLGPSLSNMMGLCTCHAEKSTNGASASNSVFGVKHGPAKMGFGIEKLSEKVMNSSGTHGRRGHS